jgi:signal transduction histidine kinase
MVVGALVLMFVDRHTALPVGSDQWTFSNVLNDMVNIAGITIGVVLAFRRPDNRIGWLFLAAGFALGLSAFGTAYGLHALVSDPGSLPAGRAFAWIGSWTGLIPVGMLAFLFLLFPTGHLRSPRWRPVAWFAGCAFALVTGALLVFSTLGWKDPYSQSSSGGSLIGFLLFALPFVFALAASLAAVVVRFRGSVGDERLQLKWFATGAALVVPTFIASFFLSSSSSGSPPAAISVVQSLAFVFLFAAIGVAVMKYRLYEIDVVISKTVVYGVLAAFFTAVYVAVVVGIGTAIGSTNNPFLTLLAAAMIALAFNPVRDRAKRIANRIVYGKRASPYEVLSEFSERMAGSYSVEDVLPQMAAILGEGTGAQGARVWLRIGGELRSAASWGEPGGINEPLPAPDGALPSMEGVSRVVAVRHQDELLGVLTVTKPPNEPLSAADGKLVDDLAAQAGLVLRNVRLTEELRANLEELRASRQRLVTAQDEERRRIERNIHDGAQQQLVAIAVKLNLTSSLIGRDDDKAQSLVNQLKAEASDALEDLRDLARGIYPPLLADKGLATALGGQARKSPVPVSIEATGVGRFAQEVEAAVYFCCLEAIQNAAKYAHATGLEIVLAADDSDLRFVVVDNGVGYDSEHTPLGSGLRNMADRLSALGGSIEISSKPGSGTRVAGRIPIPSSS